MRSSRMSAKLMPFSCRYERALPICWDITSEYSSDFTCSPSSIACEPADIPKDSVSQNVTRGREVRLQPSVTEHPTCLSCDRSLDLRETRSF